MANKKDKSQVEQNFVEMDSKGNLQIVSLVTGDIVKKDADLEDVLVGGYPAVQRVSYNAHKYIYSNEIAAAIIHRVSQGDTIATITSYNGMPNRGAIARWENLYPDFGEAMSAARSVRAEHHADQIADLVDGKLITKDEVPGAKIKIDALKWLAKVADPDRFGDKTTLRGDSTAPIHYIIDTGIKDTAMDADYEEIDDVEIRERDGEREPSQDD